MKLDFKDVLVRPKRSTLKSRSEVDLCRSFTFRNSGQTYDGVPVMAANMDTVGTFEMAKALLGVSALSVYTNIILSMLGRSLLQQMREFWSTSRPAQGRGRGT